MEKTRRNFLKKTSIFAAGSLIIPTFASELPTIVPAHQQFRLIAFSILKKSAPLKAMRLWLIRIMMG